MSKAMSVTHQCSQALRLGAELAADPVETCRAGALLLRGSPSVARWLAGWATAEFPPQVLAAHALCAVSRPPVDRYASALSAQKAGQVLETALEGAFGAGFGESVRHPLDSAAALRIARSRLIDATRQRRRYSTQTTDISYGPGGRGNLLDIWRRPDLPVGHRAPVLIHVPGGAWTINDKRGQGYPLMTRMVELGWICVSINYRKSPRNAWPTHLVDVKRAIAWVRQNIAGFGGDPDFIAITGGSAGAHLGSLAALTANDPALQPGFEDSNTAVQAAVPHYGVYDLTNTEAMHELMLPFLEHFVMRAGIADNRPLFESASPIFHAHRDAPPFFILHGSNDAVIPALQAVSFAGALRGAGAQIVAHAELPNAHHAFDTLATVRSQVVAEAVARFLAITYGRHLQLDGNLVDVHVNSAS